MIWHYQKLSEDALSVVYAYRWNSEEFTGQLKYDKTTNEYSVIKVADNDNQKGAEWALSHLPDVIKNGCPEKDIVMIG